VYQSGAGGMIRINKNIAYKWTYNYGPRTYTQAELVGAWVTLILAMHLNIEALQVCSDSKIIIDWLTDKGNL
jgi:ribonuclease HI